LDLSPDSGHEHGATADGFTVVFFVVEAQIEVPPIVKQSHEVGHESAWRELAGSKAVPAPLVFEFVKTVFRVGPVAVMLGHDLGGKGDGI
jgi:hypothetical protein